jgi:hypothetical protein
MLDPKPQTGRLYPPFKDADTPAEIRPLERDKRGYPIPFFVDRRADRVDGGDPDFRIMSASSMTRCIKEKLCWICGKKLGPMMCFAVGPMCGINRTNSEPPSHGTCAFWSARACPFFSQPKRLRDDEGLPEGDSMAGQGILRDPGVTLLWHTESYKVHRAENGILFEIGEPIMVQWAREGRQATRDEVLESISTGLPTLLDATAEHDGAAGCFELGRMTERFMQYVPAKAVPNLIAPKQGLIIP